MRRSLVRRGRVSGGSKNGSPSTRVYLLVRYGLSMARASDHHRCRMKLRSLGFRSEIPASLGGGPCDFKPLNAF